MKTCSRRQRRTGGPIGAAAAFALCLGLLGARTSRAPPMMCATFVAPNSGIIVGGLALAGENPSRSTDGCRQAPFLSSLLAASSSASSAVEFSKKESAHRYDGYDRPIFLLGLSSPP